jgi:hypothetical protein
MHFRLSKFQIILHQIKYSVQFKVYLAFVDEMDHSKQKTEKYTFPVFSRISDPSVSLNSNFYFRHPWVLDP